METGDKARRPAPTAKLRQAKRDNAFELPA
jgi:hypothetical protein